MPSNITVAKYIALFVLCVFAIEHVARTANIQYRPSTAIALGARLFKAIFSAIGKGLAHISSFLTWINIEEIKVTICGLLNPTIDCMFSFKELFVGYFSVAIIYDNPLAVIVGTVVLAVGVLYVLYRNDIVRSDNIGVILKRTSQGVAVGVVLVSICAALILLVDTIKRI